METYQLLVDAVVCKYFERRNHSAELNQLCRFLEQNDELLAYREEYGELMVLCLGSIAEDHFNDEMLLEYSDLDESELNDVERLKYARTCVTPGNASDDDYFGVFAHELVASDGRVLFLGYRIVDCGQGGYAPSWIEVSPRPEAHIESYLVSKDVWVFPMQGEIPDEELMARWRR